MQKSKFLKSISTTIVATMLLINSSAFGMSLHIDNKTIEYTLAPISMYVNEEKVKVTTMKPIQLDGRVLVPTREVSEALGGNVEWNNATKTVTIKYKNKTIILKINDINATINDEQVKLDVPAKIINNKVMVPIRFVSEAMGLEVIWNDEQRAVYIEEPKKVDISINTSSSEGEKADDYDSEQNTSINTENTESDVAAGLQYENGSKQIILHGVAGIENQIKVIDDYRNRTLIFDLGKDLSSIIKSETIQVNDSAIKSIQISNGKSTVITVNTKTVYSYEITQDDNTLVIDIVKPHNKYDKVVILDIGHGGSDPGTVVNGFREKKVNYDQAMALFNLLERDNNIKVYLTRDDDTYCSLSFRSELANEIDGDLFVSIHNNSTTNKSTKGTETLYNPHSRNNLSKKVARLVQNSMKRNLDIVDRGIVPRENLHVLRETDMPAILIEVGFLSNVSEAQKVSSPSFINSWARAVYGAIVEAFDIL